MRVGATTVPKASSLVSASDSIHLARQPEPYVSRAGRKLAGALDRFGVDVSGLRAVDLGASTGGFTDCLLQRGVSSVTAVDVGYGQLHWRIRSDPRVTVIERTNVRTADPVSIGAPFDLIVGDLSFISLRIVARALEQLGGEESIWILLIKPQFEVGRDRVGPRGIVGGTEDRAAAIQGEVDALSAVGLGCQALAVSSITGTTGNVEFVAMFDRTHGTIDRATIDAISEEQP